MKVLMLGWEFPPILSGGLGIATYGIVDALRQHMQIKLILPKAGPACDLDKVTTIGLNQVSVEAPEDHADHPDWVRVVEEVERIPLAVSPYHHINQILLHQHEEREPIPSVAKAHPLFASAELYGEKIMQRVSLYASLADQLANPVDFDVIHAHDWLTFPAAQKIRTRTGKPMVLHVHALETDRAGETTRNEIYELEREAFAQADRILAVSQYTRQQMIQHYHVDRDKIDVVHNGIEPHEFTRKKHALTEKYIVFLGRITHQKGPDFLLETAEKLVRILPNVKFVVAGAGDQFAHLLQTTAYKKLGSKFIFAGFLNKPKVDELLSMADVYFMPSVSEPFGLTALEAAQHNVPTVISKESGVREVLHDSLVADFWDTDRYANYLYALLTYEVLHKVIAEKARHELRALTWQHAAEKILANYIHLIHPN